MERVIVSISIDTEEDNWGDYARDGASVENIAHLVELQDLFDQWGARPTYLVNRAPLRDRRSVEVLGEIGNRESVEIGAHCHPWNTPPFREGQVEPTMMCQLSTAENDAKLGEVGRCLMGELGLRPTSFRAGRWGFGPAVGQALVAQGYRVDCSVSPFIDWSSEGGPDYGSAPWLPYRFSPAQPLRDVRAGALVELPTTIGFLRGNPARANRLRRRLEASPLARFKVVGLLDRVGLLARRWLSPETSSGATMVRLADACTSAGSSFLQLTFHSCTLLPGATPFVRTEDDRRRFLRDLEAFLLHCSRSHFTFRTLGEAAVELCEPQRTESPGQR